jgi:hypothetical protein
LKTHFASKNYDYFKYKGKIKANPVGFEERKDRFHFKRLSKKYDKNDIQDFFVANILMGKSWIGEFSDDNAHDFFMDYQKRKQSFSYSFTVEIDKILIGLKTIQDLFKTKKGMYPKVIDCYLSGELSLESLSVLEHFISFSDKFDKAYGRDDIIWGKVRLLIEKIYPFVEYDKDRIKAILKKTMLINT